MSIVNTLNRVVMAVLVIGCFQLTAYASSDNYFVDEVDIDLGDQPSLQNGAKLFVNYCLSCHSAAFMRYNRMAEDLGIPEKVVQENMMFAGDKIGGLMETTMPEEDARQWFGVAPPDLSLTARLRGPDWLYSYLRKFYLDLDSPSGWNNLVFENVAMPHALYELQGRQRAVFKTETDDAGREHQVFDKFEVVTAGKMSVEEYDLASRDLTRFLVYLAEPAKLVRGQVGVWVLLFLIVLGVLSYFLKKEYWRDIH
jgi:ubiquinol-cytochrome c reductase cytochrome c1 subunit